VAIFPDCGGAVGDVGVNDDVGVGDALALGNGVTLAAEDVEVLAVDAVVDEVEEFELTTCGLV